MEAGVPKSYQKATSTIKDHLTESNKYQKYQNDLFLRLM